MSTVELEAFRKELLTRFEIQLHTDQALTLGEICKTVYRADCAGERLVVKAAFDEKGRREVALNMSGYAEMREIGAAALLPHRLEYVEVLGIPTIIMSDCGLDFWHAVHHHPHPVALYRAIARDMGAVYRATRREVDGPCQITATQGLLLRQYETHLHAHIDEQTRMRLRQLDAPSLSPRLCCFASFDFTPEDVFVTDAGVRYVDPKPGMLGVPILDMACFAGVARDAYTLPGSKKGYRLLREFALEICAPLLDISKDKAIRIFHLGRALQNAFSGRFRLVKEPERARSFIKKSVWHLTRAA